MKRGTIALLAFLGSFAVAVRAVPRRPPVPDPEVLAFLPESPLAIRTARTRPETLHVLVLIGRAIDRRAHDVSARLLVRTPDGAQTIGMLSEGRNALGAVVSMPRASLRRGVGIEVTVDVGGEQLTASQTVLAGDVAGDAAGNAAGDATSPRSDARAEPRQSTGTGAASRPTPAS